MKKSLLKSLMISAICLLGVQVFAQKSYLTFSAGYGLKMSTQNVPDLSMYNFATDLTGFTTREQINLSLGKGFVAEGSYGFMFLKNVGAELGISYLSGEKTNSRFTYATGKIEYDVSATMLRLVPSIVIKGNGEKVVPYARFGVVTGLGTVTLDENNETSDVRIERRTTKFNKGLAFGLTAGLGLITRISNRVALITEMNMLNQSYAPEKSEVTKYTVNGANSLDKLTVSEKEANYYDSIKLTVIETDKPRPLLKQKLPFGSVGLKIGLQINL